MEKRDIATLRNIGQGFSSTVWAPEEGPILKREDGGPYRSLKNDFEMHRRILQHLEKLPYLRLKVQIPACFEFISVENQTWWYENHQKFPTGYRTPCNLIQSQRIPPFPEAIRQIIIQNFCPPQLISEISASLPNKDCLIRPYLGRRRRQRPRPDSTSRFTPFSLRNFPLHLDQMELLGISTGEIHQYARLMAETLAMMHWIIEIDGNDIEFVLAPPANANKATHFRNGLEIVSRVLQVHSMWVLDFDLCRQMAMDSKGVQQAATAFWRNDPYYPRPGKAYSTDISLWTVFRQHYIQTSKEFIDISIDKPLEAERRRGLSKQTVFDEIGVGSVGKVFGQLASPWAFKVLLLDRTEKLWNNYIMRLRIQYSFDALGEMAGLVEVPRVAWFADKSSTFWEENLDLFPDESTFPRRPREVLCMERVFPLPEKIRHALIDVFCSPVNSSKAKATPANKDCLVRLLLGRKRYGASRPGGSMFFSLRNFKLHVDQIQELELDAEEYARNMADALAVLHWHTKVDAMDIEFVLGSTPLDRNSVRRALPLKDIERLVPGSSTYEHTINANSEFKKRTVSLWILDFDACSSISMDEPGLRQAVKAFFGTDPFCPRPYSQDTYSQNLWAVFSERYITTGRRVSNGQTWQGLPARFVQSVIDELMPRDKSIRPDSTMRRWR
ncbi:hypothetical protein N7492_003896 [Penicillium capsulatum]|uniref:DUF3669 domain-containing protein n=1 Tax=Penicillium capsulatum TaxID=69766 RepID=A0A9W9LWI1_9EURO|nr:hypothetical protein N7492_003896 [Penicillium capsulatum]KAJ6121524.1 hypothetical protein N7512_003989 [Penicillium capsulatum]